jgi:dihydroorotase
MLLFWLLLAIGLRAQSYDLLLKGGHVIDPANGIDGVRDVAIAGGTIAAVAENIPESSARTVKQVGGHYVTPGLIDMHTHVYLKGRSATVVADQSVLPHGTTTIVDAGVAGWKTFADFKQTVIDVSRTRVLAMLNIVGGGMNDDTSKENDVADMDPTATAAMARRYPGVIVGIKTAHFALPGWAAVQRAVEAGRLANLPVMLDSHVLSNSGRDTRTKVLELMRPGDIHTHTYNDHQLELVDRFTGKVQPWMWEARKRGVLFDLGHGGGSFLWPVARASMREGFPPDTISTDLHPGSILTLQVNMANCISKLLALGMSLPDAIQRATVNPARALRQFPELGTLGTGRTADIAVFRLQKGVFAFIDSHRNKLTGDRNLACVMTVRAGQVVYDRPAGAGEAAEIYDIVLRHGRVVDPANHRDGRFDIGIRGGKVARIAESIRADSGRMVVDLTDYYVTPGLVDARASVDYLDGQTGAQPDQFELPQGVTTVVDPNASPNVVRRSRTHVIVADNSRLPPEVLFSGVDRMRTLAADSGIPAALAKLIVAGVPFAQAIERATALPARVLRISDAGALREGGPADIAVFEAGSASVTCILAFRNGDPVWDLHGLTIREWTQTPPYSAYR